MEGKKMIKRCTKIQWEYLSYNRRQWYERNCSRPGSFETTLRIIEGAVK